MMREIPQEIEEKLKMSIFYIEDLLFGTASMVLDRVYKEEGRENLKMRENGLVKDRHDVKMLFEFGYFQLMRDNEDVPFGIVATDKLLKPVDLGIFVNLGKRRTIELGYRLSRFLGLALYEVENIEKCLGLKEGEYNFLIEDIINTVEMEKLQKEVSWIMKLLTPEQLRESIKFMNSKRPKKQIEGQAEMKLTKKD